MPEATIRGVRINYLTMGVSGPWVTFNPGGRRDHSEMLPLAKGMVERGMQTGMIEVAPLAFMRGRTLSNAFIILDEAQNTTPVQMKMALTRMGENSRMAVTGDLSQVDLPRGMRSGLAEAVHVLQDMEGVAFVRFGQADVVRHPLVTRIVKAYEERGTNEQS